MVQDVSEKYWFQVHQLLKHLEISGVCRRSKLGELCSVTVGTDKSSNEKWSHIHREILINHFNDSKTAQGE